MTGLEILTEKVISYKENIPVFTGNVVKDNETIVVEYITQDQLFEKGEDSEGKSLGEYSPFTVEIKQLKQQPTDRITLKDEGNYHESHRIEVTEDGGFKIVVSDFKYGELVERFGPIDSLNDENLNDLIQAYIFPELLNKLKSL